MIEQYIGQSIDCACGRTHRSRVETIEIKRDVIRHRFPDFFIF